MLETRRPSPSDTGVSWLSYLLWGPMRHRSIGILVYAPDYVTLESQSDGFDWLEDPIPTQMGASKIISARLTRKGSTKAGFDYSINLKRAVSEQEWIQKCTWTINVSASREEPFQTWLFNDLTGYLEKWPEGEKAGDYMYAALKTGLLLSPERITELMREGKLTLQSLEMYRTRNESLLRISGQVKHPALSDIDKPFYDHEVDQLESNLKVIDSLLSTGGAR